MPPNVKPPTQAEIEEAIKKIHSKVTPPASPTLTTPTYSGNSEIGAALAQFEKDQQGFATPQVKDTVDVMSSHRIDIQEEAPKSKMVQRVIKWSGGAIKDKRQAEYILLVFAVIAMGISLYLFFAEGGGTQSTDPNLPSGFPM